MLLELKTVAKDVLVRCILISVDCISNVDRYHASCEEHVKHVANLLLHNNSVIREHSRLKKKNIIPTLFKE